jgi:hypothetical protein
MNARPLGSGHLWSCPEGHGVFLARIDLGSLVESETDWHRLASQGTDAHPAHHRGHGRPAHLQDPAEGLGGDPLQLASPLRVERVWPL